MRQLCSQALPCLAAVVCAGLASLAPATGHAEPIQVDGAFQAVSGESDTGGDLDVVANDYIDAVDATYQEDIPKYWNYGYTGFFLWTQHMTQEMKDISKRCGNGLVTFTTDSADEVSFREMDVTVDWYDEATHRAALHASLSVSQPLTIEASHNGAITCVNATLGTRDLVMTYTFDATVDFDVVDVDVFGLGSVTIGAIDAAVTTAAASIDLENVLLANLLMPLDEDAVASAFDAQIRDDASVKLFFADVMTSLLEDQYGALINGPDFKVHDFSFVPTGIHIDDEEHTTIDVEVDTALSAAEQDAVDPDCYTHASYVPVPAVNGSYDLPTDMASVDASTAFGVTLEALNALAYQAIRNGSMCGIDMNYHLNGLRYESFWPTGAGTVARVPKEEGGTEIRYLTNIHLTYRAGALGWKTRVLWAYVPIERGHKLVIEDGVLYIKWYFRAGDLVVEPLDPLGNGMEIDISFIPNMFADFSTLALEYYADHLIWDRWLVHISPKHTNDFLMGKATIIDWPPPIWPY